ncbi:hypothetical protein PybrP1_001297 [[Pythium] brassicae (nom. inval.)]|nr:hypothetical protein PybrP1_001297 [[Pythium] brassicae (nom. inval.)]
MVELRFVKPAVRDRWTGVSLVIAQSVMTLVATDSLAAADTTTGFDEGAVQLLYQVELIGRGDLSVTTTATSRSDGDGYENILVHHPRAARRFPCSACLSTQHHRRECNERDPEKAARRYTLELQYTPQEAPVHLDPSRGQHAFKRPLKRVRKAIVPKVADRLRREKEEVRNKSVKAAAKRVAIDAAEAARSRRSTRKAPAAQLM